MIPEMKKDHVVIDDYNWYETDALIKKMRPDFFFSGIKDKYSVMKDGCTSRQIHSYDYSGPYAGFQGATNFGRDLTMSLYCAAWGLVKAPWETQPDLSGSFGGEA